MPAAGAVVVPDADEISQVVMIVAAINDGGGDDDGNSDNTNQ